MNIKANKLIQLLLITLTITGIVGFYLYIDSTASTKINSSQDMKLTDGLVGHWTMDGNDIDWSAAPEIIDQAGSSHGTTTNMDNSNAVIGKVGQSLDLDGSTEHVDVGDIDIITDKITASAWINLESFVGGTIYSGIITKNYTTSWFLGTYGATRDLSVFINGDQRAYTTGQPISFGEWAHVAFTYDRYAGGVDEVKVYVNGNQVATGDYSGELGLNDDNIEIGKNYSQYFDGQIDEVRLYDRALPATEIAELYSQGQVKINASQDSKLADGLTAYWTMDGNDITWTGASTGIITDRAGNGYAGVLTDMSQAATPKVGKIGQALHFDGIDDYIDMGDADIFEVTNPISFSFWAKFDNLAGRIIGKWSGGCDEAWFITTTANGVQLNFDGTDDSGLGCGQVSFRESSIPSLGTWYYYVITYDGSRTNGGVNIYRDASEGHTIPNDTGFPVTILNDNPLRIGARSRNTPPNSAFFNGGALDEFRIYNRELSQNEISELYNQGQVKINASQETKLTDGLVGNWTFDGNHMDWSAAPEVKDQAGSNDGTLTGTVATIGKTGQALDFNGSSDYIDLGSPNLGFSGFAYCAWVYPKDLTSSQVIMHYTNASGNDSLGLRLNNWGVGKFDIFDGNNSIGITTTAIVINNWSHICLTTDNLSDVPNNNMKSYINGVYDASRGVAYNPWLSVPSDQFYIANPIWGGGKFNGSLDEIRIYNRGLSADEVNQIYMMGK